MSRSAAAARRLVLRRLISAGSISSQEELVQLLGKKGHRVTQTTVSRDLTALGVEKVASGNGEPVYALPVSTPTADSSDDRLQRMLRAFALDIDRAGSLVVIKTPPASANPVASALDQSPPSGVLGTIAGDDTVLVILRSEAGGKRLVRKLETLLGGPR